ncbi:MAG: glycosyltransferase [Flexilinea sp.]
MKILHVITDLDRGGAEIMLSRVLPQLRSAGCTQKVVCLSGPGEIGKQISDSGFSVTYLNMKRSSPDLNAFFQLIRIIRQENPELIHSWLYHADLYTSLADLFLRKPLVWGIHNSTLGVDANRITKIIVRVLSWLSHFIPRRIISCSGEAIRIHKEMGYRSDIMRFVPNGFDTDLFQPDKEAGKALRVSLGIPENELLVGNISRFDQQKNHKGLIKCWGQLSKENPEVRFLLAGKNLDRNNRVLLDYLTTAGISEKTILLGIRDDVPKLLNALDLFVLSSNSGEAFPLIVGEAMSCGIICVGTKVGDTELLIDDCGKTVPPDDPESLKKACLSILDLPEHEKAVLKEKSRKRIIENFTLQKMGEAYFSVYQEILRK